ncbi:MAG: hypothetical protein U0527_14545 [Candidatus Eisenbacteria bacterium]
MPRPTTRSRSTSIHGVVTAIETRVELQGLPSSVSVAAGSSA